MSLERIGRYEIVSELGRGGMAIVYLARDPLMKREVAIKVLPRQFTFDEQFRSRFKREAEAIASLEHARVVPVYDFGEHDEQPFIVMRYMPGGSLADRIGQGPLPVDESADILGKIADALDGAHKRGIIHRDVKPSNILFDQYADAFLSDFGIVKLTESTSQLTGGGILGTPSYMAPELARAGGLSPLVDVYALGVTLYQMLTGKLPYEADTPMGVLMAHGLQPIPDARLARPDLPDAVQAVIERGMAKNPAERYPTAGDLVDGLMAAARDESRAQPARAASAPPIPQPLMPPTPPQAATMDVVEGGALVHPPTTQPPAYRTEPRPRKRPFPWAWVAGGIGGLACLIVIGGVVVAGSLGLIPFPSVAGSAATGAPTDSPDATAAPTAGNTPTFEEPLVVSSECQAGGSALKEIAALDRLTVRFTFCRPEPAFLAMSASATLGIQPREWIEQNGGAGEMLSHPVGTGPYMFDSWNRANSITFKRFDDYWGEKALTEMLIFRWNSEASVRLLELQAGTADGIDEPPAEEIQSILDSANLRLYRREALNLGYLGMSNNFPPWDDVQVRQAIAQGLDRRAIAENSFPAGTEVATHFTPCAIPNGCVGDAWYDFNPQAARDLLAQAGYPNGFSTRIYYRDVPRPYWADPTVAAQEIQSQLKANLNITADIVVMDSGEFITQATSGQLDGLYMLGWVVDYPHITDFLDPFFKENNPQFGTPYPEIYNLLTEADSIADPAEAQSIYAEANNQIRELVPMVPLVHSASFTAFRADVEGAYASPMYDEHFAQMKPGGRDTFIWMQAVEPISLYCADTYDTDSMRACSQIVETLMVFKLGEAGVEPALATGCEPSDGLTVWTCTLRDGVHFHDGSLLDANDVVMSWVVQWDASSPYHTGNTGSFTWFAGLWGFINAPPGQ